MKLKYPRRLWRLAKQLLDNPERLQATVQAAEEQSTKVKQHLQEVFDGFRVLIRLVRAWAKGEYRVVPKQTVLRAAFAILYFLLLVDLIPDFIPGIGLIDDVSVIAWTLRSLHDDLEEFKKWEQKPSTKSKEDRH